MLYFQVGEGRGGNPEFARMEIILIRPRSCKPTLLTFIFLLVCQQALSLPSSTSESEQIREKWGAGCCTRALWGAPAGMELSLGPRSPGNRVTGEAHKLSTPITELSHKCMIFIYMEKGRHSGRKEVWMAFQVKRTICAKAWRCENACS